MVDQVLRELRANTQTELAATMIMKSNVFRIVTLCGLVNFTDIKEEITASILKKAQRKTKGAEDSCSCVTEDYSVPGYHTVSTGSHRRLEKS